ncbi:MAG: L-cysteine S-thiosulfotransferase, partial [Hyphomicrobiales bacterium]
MTFALVAVLQGDLSHAESSPSQRRSGYELMGRDTKAMQDDDTSNPATLSVLDGESLWTTKAGTAGKSCADCHGDAEASMRGVSARYPALDSTRGRPVDIEQRINLCRTEKQNATPLPFESRELLAITAYLGKQSRGEPIAVA